MTSSSLVSVIIPAFNSERWIRDAIDSVFAQTHRQLEVIVGDNGSTDGTRPIVASYGGRVTLAVAEVKGPGAARNAGLELARGDFVQFLDSDDLLEPWKIERQLAVLEETGADIVWGPFQMYDEDPATGAFSLGARSDPALPDDVALGIVGDGFLQIGCVLQRQTPVLAALRFLPTEHLEEIDYHLRAALSGARFVRGSGDSGLLFRQHSALRVSDGPELRIAVGTVRNVRMLKKAWLARGELTPQRRVGLVTPLLYAARVFARYDPRALHDALAEIRSIDPAFMRRLPWKLRIPARVLGYERMERAAARYRAVKALLTPRPANHRAAAE